MPAQMLATERWLSIGAMPKPMKGHPSSPYRFNRVGRNQRSRTLRHRIINPETTLSATETLPAIATAPFALEGHRQRHGSEFPSV